MSSVEFNIGEFPQNLALKIVVGMIAGFIVGFCLSPESFNLLSPDKASIVGEWLALPGGIFLALLKMIIIPLVLCSIILGISTGHDIDFLKKLGLRLVLYFIVTTTIAISIGVTVVKIINPGQYVSQDLIERSVESAPQIDVFDNLTIPQRVLNVFPTNLTKASYETNMLQIVVFAIFLGVVCVLLKPDIVKPFHDLCVFGQSASMQIVTWAMYIAPIAVFGLLADITMQVGVSSLISVGAYFISVVLGLALMLFAYAFILSVFGRFNALRFFAKAKSAQLLAFSTSSSASVIPVSIENAEERLGVRPEISRFVIPLGATINMDGTAMYQGIAAVFLTQVFGIELSFLELLTLIVTTVGASIGTPGTPGVGLVILATILTTIGVPPSGVALILGVDRILDMCRTTVNVTGDLTASVIMNRFIHHERT